MSAFNQRWIKCGLAVLLALIVWGVGTALLAYA